MVATIKRFEKASTLEGVVRANGDERLQREASESLRTSGYAMLTSISCRVVDGILTLRGSVPTFYLKQIAQHYASRTTGVKEIQNQVSVVDTRG